MGVAIVTDTVACLPSEVIQSHGIEVIPLQIIHNGITYLDGVDITAARLHVVVHHTNCAEETLILKEKLESNLNYTAISMQDFTPVMGLHTCPGLMGMAYCIQSTA